MLLKINKYKNQIMAVSGVLILGGVILNWLGYSGVKAVLFILAAVIASIPIGIRAFQALRMKAFSIELLVIIAVTGALYIREYTEAAVVTFLFLFGAYLEARTLEKTRSSLKSLMDLAPQEAVVIRDGERATIPADEVEEGDTVVILSGGKIPVDGKVISGKGTVDEAAITGEAIPVTKEVDQKVFSGTIMDNGYLEIIAEKVGDDTTFSKIIELVEEAEESKTKAEKFLDRFANIYTPAIIILAVLVLVITKQIRLAITFLVVACPGALVIGAPVSNVTGIGNGARNGVLIKGGDVMEKLSKVDTVVFDKTGTLTKGKPEVNAVKVFGGHNPEDFLRLTASLESISEHHLGQAIVREARRKNQPITEEVLDGEVLKGYGLKGNVQNHQMIAGNRKFMRQEKIPLSQEVLDYASGQEKAGQTAIFVAKDGELAGVISIADEIREDAWEAISSMRKSGVKRFVMLTGDNRHTADLVSRRLQLDEVHSELLPEEKVNYIKELKEKGYIVAMAGDGINDAPAIATADIGLAMGEGGTDVSMETADVVLMADKLLQFSHAYALAKATIRNMKENIFIAVAIVIILLGGVLFGYIHLASGMFIHEASILLVIFNAMRLIRFKSRA